MAGSKISQLVQLALGSIDSAADRIPILDNSGLVNNYATPSDIVNKALRDGISQVWNDAGTTFTAWLLSITDTASNAASKLIDLKVGGASVASIDKSGKYRCGPLSAGNMELDANLLAFNWLSTQRTRYEMNVISAYSPWRIRWSDNASGPPTSNISIELGRDATGTIYQRSGTTPQAYNLYNTYTDASNYERLEISWSSNVCRIRPTAAGTGSTRVVHLSGLPTSNPGPGILWNNAGTPAIGT